MDIPENSMSMQSTGTKINLSDLFDNLQTKSEEGFKYTSIVSEDSKPISVIPIVVNPINLKSTDISPITRINSIDSEYIHSNPSDSSLSSLQSLHSLHSSNSELDFSKSKSEILSNPTIPLSIVLPVTPSTSPLITITSKLSQDSLGSARRSPFTPKGLHASLISDGKGYLNKLTNEKFDTIASKFCALPTKTEEAIDIFVNLIVETTLSLQQKAIENNMLYAKLCKKIINEWACNTDFTCSEQYMGIPKNRIFEIKLLTKCFDMFANDWDNDFKELKKDSITLPKTDRDDKENKFRARLLHLVCFVGNLYLVDIIEEDKLMVIYKYLSKSHSELTLNYLHAYLGVIGAKMVKHCTENLFTLSTMIENSTNPKEISKLKRKADKFRFIDIIYSELEKISIDHSEFRIKCIFEELIEKWRREWAN